MAKKEKLTTHTEGDLKSLIEKRREELRALRFSVAGSKNRNVKLSRTLRHDIARALTAARGLEQKK